MIKVVGGTYLEHCADPFWNELYGSGLRAAAALSTLSEIEFYTYASNKELANLKIFATSFGFSYFSETRPDSISFSYEHPLSAPKVSPPIGLFSSRPAIKVDGEVVLRFGMLEGNAQVNADRAIYDPQSAFNPEPFHANGSKAKHLAMVLNYAEAARLTGSRNLEEIGKVLINSLGAEIVIVKQGSRGCAVLTSGAVARIPAYRTPRVWPIGSGDIFAAAFAHHWGERRESALEAARLASMSTALFCESQILPLPHDIQLRAAYAPIEFDPARAEKALIYLAGPFFNIAERWLITQARNAIKDQGIKVFSPYHDVGIGVASDVVPADLKALDECTAVLAILDHFDPGTVFEIGWARKRDIPVTLLVENEREEALKMFVGTNCEILKDFSTAIYRTIWTAISK